MTLQGNRPNRQTVWYLFILIAILALVVGTTLGEVWHRHVNTSPETCPICHLSHQTAEPAAATVRLEKLVPEGPGPKPLIAAFVTRLVVPQLPARAPPA
jgi:hypothetical protein